MKKLICLIISLFVSIPAITANDDNSDETVYLYTITGEDEEGDIYTDPDPSRRKLPQPPILCFINADEGIRISCIDIVLIDSFEIFDTYGNPVGIFVDEESFLATLFSLQGEYRLIFRLADRTLFGRIEL